MSALGLVMPEASFNWATRSRAWKHALRSCPGRRYLQLQLGHALSRVETPMVNETPTNPYPLQLGHALSRVETPNTLYLTASLKSASIGPRALARGNPGYECRADVWQDTLQLGHALSRVETDLFVMFPRWQDQASIG